MQLTVAVLGVLRLLLYRSSDANLFLLTTKSIDGPISSSSILGTLLPDFFIKTLKNKKLAASKAYSIPPQGADQNPVN